MGACRRTSNRQEHKITQRAGPEQDTIFHLHVTACRRRGSHRQDQRLAWVASRGQGTSCSSSFVSKVLGANYKTANNFLPVAQKFTMCNDRKQPLNLPVMRMRVWIRHVYCINMIIGIYTDHTVMGKDIDTPVRLKRATRSEADTLEEECSRTRLGQVERPPHLNGVIYWSNQAAFHLGHGNHCSHCNNRMGAVWHAILHIILI